MTPLSDFIDGTIVLRVAPPAAVRVSHVMSRRHATLRTGGLEVESLHLGSGAFERMGENARNLLLSRFPTIDRFRDFGTIAYLRFEREILDDLRNI